MCYSRIIKAHSSLRGASSCSSDRTLVLQSSIKRLQTVYHLRHIPKGTNTPHIFSSTLCDTTSMPMLNKACSMGVYRLFPVAIVLLLARQSEAEWICSGRRGECSRHDWCFQVYEYEHTCVYTGFGSQCCGNAPLVYIQANYGTRRTTS